MTRWSSAFSDPQWLEVDLGASLPVCQVVLQWENAYATGFQIQVSTDNSTWTPIYSTTTGTGGTQTLNVSGTGRYIRMYGTARATGYGYSLWEFGVYTVGGVTATIPPPPPQPAPGNCPWLNSPNTPVATRVAELMGQMTQDQKDLDAARHRQLPTYIGRDPGHPVAVHPQRRLRGRPGRRR